MDAAIVVVFTRSDWLLPYDIIPEFTAESSTNGGE